MPGRPDKMVRFYSNFNKMFWQRAVDLALHMNAVDRQRFRQKTKSFNSLPRLSALKIKNVTLHKNLRTVFARLGKLSKKAILQVCKICITGKESIWRLKVVQNIFGSFQRLKIETSNAVYTLQFSWFFSNGFLQKTINGFVKHYSEGAESDVGKRDRLSIRAQRSKKRNQRGLKTEGRVQSSMVKLDRECFSDSICVVIVYTRV